MIVRMTTSLQIYFKIRIENKLTFNICISVVERVGIKIVFCEVYQTSERIKVYSIVLTLNLIVDYFEKFQ